VNLKQLLLLHKRHTFLLFSQLQWYKAIIVEKTDGHSKRD
jgi:hypothetical protein